MATAITRFLITLLLIFILPLALVSCKQTTPKQKTQAEQQETQVAQQDVYEEHPSHVYTREYYQRKTQAAPRKVENPVFAEWRAARGRQMPKGTRLDWNIQVWGIGDYHYSLRGMLEGMLEMSPSYEVVCTLEGSKATPEKRQEVYRTMLSVVKDDWVRAQGRFRYVDDSGRVVIALEDLRNLGPSY